MENKDAVRRLYLVKHMNPKKLLSLLCRGFSDIGTYTTGFPVSNEPGVPDMFSIVKKILPGPVTNLLSNPARSDNFDVVHTDSQCQQTIAEATC